jgi:high-affinity iron transporter
MSDVRCLDVDVVRGTETDPSTVALPIHRAHGRYLLPVGLLLLLLVVLASGCGGGARGSSSTSTSTRATSARESSRTSNVPGTSGVGLGGGRVPDTSGVAVGGGGQAAVLPEVDLAIRRGALQTEAAAVRLQAGTHAYLRLVRAEAEAASKSRSPGVPRSSTAPRHKAVAQITRALEEAQARYWPIAALVAAVPSLSRLDLGEGPSSTSVRPDDSPYPLAEVAGQLSALPGSAGTGVEATTSVAGEPLVASPRRVHGATGTAASVPSASALVSGAASLAQAGSALRRQSQELALGATHAPVSVAELRGAVSSGLSVLIANAQVEAEGKGSTPFSEARTRATLAGLTSVICAASESSSQGAALNSLVPRLSYLSWLVNLPAPTRGLRFMIAQESAWSATDLAAQVARGTIGIRSARDDAAASAMQNVEVALFRARWEQVLGRRAAAIAEVERARRAFALFFGAAPTRASAGHSTIAAVGEFANASAWKDLDEALAAARSGEARALAAARGRVVASIVTAAYRQTLLAVARNQPTDALRWAAVRDLGPSAPSAGIDDDAIQAIDALAAEKETATATATVISRDELDVLQRRTVTLVQQATQMAYLGFGPAQAETAALAAGYWSVLSPIYAQRLGAGFGPPVDAAVAKLSLPATPATPLSLQAASSAALGALGAFTAAPATGAEQQQRIERLVQATRFTVARLCSPAPTLRIGEDQQGTAAGPPVFARTVNDLRPTLSALDVARLEQANRSLAALPGASGVSGEQTLMAKLAQPSSAARANCARATSAVEAVFPGAWNQQSDDGDFTSIESALDRTQSAASEHAWSAAQADARKAYAIFDLTPELRLRVVDPALATKIEVLFWNGGSDGRALFDALSDHATPSTLTARRDMLEQALQRARIVLDVSHSATAVAINSGIVVLREGLEALLIVAALSVGFVSAGRRWRRPVIAGALAAAPATLVTWALCSALLGSVVGYGLPLQAVLDLLSLTVLAVMLAWFFQKFCWTRFVAKERARHRQLLGAGGGALAGPAVGLLALGFTVVYREGFETVLYLQALRVQAGTGAVAEGVLLGALFTATIGFAMLVLRRRLPMRGVIVATATLIGLLAVVMTGQTIRAVQAAGWLAITPVHIDVPAWSELWLGIYPSTQTLIAQLIAAVAIVLTAVLSERVRTRRLRRRIEAARQSKRAAKAKAGRHQKRPLRELGPLS